METSSVCLSLQISLTFLQVPVAIMKNLYHSSFISYLPCFGVLLFPALISTTSSISTFLIFCLCFLCGIFRHHLLPSHIYFLLISLLSFIYHFTLYLRHSSSKCWPFFSFSSEITSFFPKERQR